MALRRRGRAFLDASRRLEAGQELERTRARFLGQLGWPNLSFAGQIGLGLEFSNPGGSGSKTAVKFVTTADDVNVVSTGTLGFHIYF